MRREFDRIIIIGFDGLDYQKIQKYECKSVMQEEFGKIDLSGIPMVTGPLWTSFITGLYPKDHGVKRTMNWTDQRVQDFENKVANNPLFEFWKGIRWTIYRNLDSLNTDVIGAYKENLRCDSTIFEDFSPSIPVNVPGYDINTALSRIKIIKALGKDAPLPKHVLERDINAEFEQRKKETFNALNEYFALLMSHIHKSDFMQHLYAFDEDKEKDLYKEMDGLAEKIKEKTSKDDLLLFCSDHGLEDGDHRDQAFYSANYKLGLDNFHITDFRDILNSFDISKQEEVSKLDL